MNTEGEIIIGEQPQKPQKKICMKPTTLLLLLATAIAISVVVRVGRC